MKLITENIDNVEYLEEIQKNIADEIHAIESYESFLKNINLPKKVEEIITEIKNDEQDHLSLLSGLLKDEVVDTYGESDEFSEEE